MTKRWNSITMANKGEGLPLLSGCNLGIWLVNLAFSTLELRTLCEKQKNAEREFGYKVAKELRGRLEDLYSADNVLVLTNEIVSVLEDDNYCAVSLSDGYYMLLRVNQRKVSLSTTRRVDWAGVTRVKIEKIDKLEVDRE